MALVGLSLLLASVVYVLVFPTGYLPSLLARILRGEAPPAPPAITLPDEDGATRPGNAQGCGREAGGGSPEQNGAVGPGAPPAAPSKADHDRASMPPPPPPPPPAIRRPEAAGPPIGNPDDGEQQTTPKASATGRADPVPTFSLAAAASDETSSRPPGPAASSPTPGLMAPPPPRLPPLSSPSSPVAARGVAPPLSARGLNPLPRRGPTSSSLAPPPTHSTLPVSKQAVLNPGHSPLDWARLSASPTSDLRGLPPGTPYLRVTPSMLKHHTGRKGKDAWMALGGKVYNVTPYVPFHPGGGPELMRGAGRDGTKLFGENHPWVNYETMLHACLVGILVDEDDGEGAMEEMD